MIEEAIKKLEHIYYYNQYLKPFERKDIEYAIRALKEVSNGRKN